MSILLLLNVKGAKEQPERSSAKSLLAMSLPRNLKIKPQNLRKVELYTLHFHRTERNGHTFFLTMPCVFLLAFRHAFSFFLVLLELNRLDVASLILSTIKR